MSELTDRDGYRMYTMAQIKRAFELAEAAGKVDETVRALDAAGVVVYIPNEKLDKLEKIMTDVLNDVRENNPAAHESLMEGRVGLQRYVPCS